MPTGWQRRDDFRQPKTLRISLPLLAFRPSPVICRIIRKAVWQFDVYRLRVWYPWRVHTYWQTQSRSRIQSDSSVEIADIDDMLIPWPLLLDSICWRV